MKEATSKQKAILGWIVSYREKNGISPTLREIGKAFGITSLRGVSVHLEALERKGFLTIYPGVTRGIVPTGIGKDASPTPGFFRIVSDGTPIKTKVFSPSGEDVSNAVPSVDFSVDVKAGVVAKIVVFSRAEVLVPKSSVEIVERMIAETVANIGNDKV